MHRFVIPSTLNNKYEALIFAVILAAQIAKLQK
jgi:hypothetical protein